MTDHSIISQALAAKGANPQSVYDALRALTQATIGAKLFTVMTYDPETGEASRVFSNMPDAYPVSGTKPLNPTHWTQIVIEEHRSFVANDYEGVRAVFNDHELIRSLGCESVINIPMITAGEVRGTINCLDVAGHYTAERVAAAESLKLAGVACLLFQKQFQTKEASNG
ncbi:hypothetical protein DEVEQU_00038 [Devosia equisanguinis]|uniref:GAF domain-containing protein n=1 Tax=Devosia equisanguinis TaxID=2490941 RepID=A0A447I601_9HYPH|nr:GAF domain-containing protein [Devosia equisanguinis]VDS02919.1 hypothetical protein DEVEQU_00038 [Devosia equisanguinis]